MIQPQLKNVVLTSKASPTLKEITIVHMVIEGLFKGLSTLYDLSTLTNLSLQDCRHAEGFLTDLGEAFKGTELALQHLAVDIDAPYSTSVESTFTECLIDVFETCPSLKSLHVGWRTGPPAPDYLLAKIRSLGSNLTLLSLFIKNRAYVIAPISSSDFDALCVACPNLQQLGYSIWEEAFLCVEGLSNYEDFMVSLHMSVWSPNTQFT
jgi:hypothetical protein